MPSENVLSEERENTDGVNKKLSTTAVASSVSALALSVFFFFDGVHKIQRHDERGWLICGGFAFIFGMHLYKLAKFEISAYQEK
jgi:hypothetical protein